MNDEMYQKGSVPIWKKLNLTAEEASKYSNIGENTIRDITNRDEANEFIVFVGKKKLLKRKEFERWLEKQFVIK